MLAGTTESRGNWHKIALPILVCILVALTLTNLVLMLDGSHEKARELQVAGLATTLREAMSSSYAPENWPCDPPMDLRSSDLCAQWKAADAARDGAEWAKWSFVLSVVTLGTIVFGFWQNDRTQKTEYSAYLRYAHIELQVPEDGRMRVAASVTNYGRTAASSISGTCIYAIGVWSPLHLEAQQVEGGFLIDRQELHPGETGKVQFFDEVPAETPESDPDRYFSVMLILILNYRDVFGRSHQLQKQKTFLVRRNEVFRTFEVLAHRDSD